jgi:hypothetical protein
MGAVHGELKAGAFVGDTSDPSPDRLFETVQGNRHQAAEGAVNDGIQPSPADRDVPGSGLLGLSVNGNGGVDINFQAFEFILGPGFFNGQ